MNKQRQSNLNLGNRLYNTIMHDYTDGEREREKVHSQQVVQQVKMSFPCRRIFMKKKHVKQPQWSFQIFTQMTSATGRSPGRAQ